MPNKRPNRPRRSQSRPRPDHIKLIAFNKPYGVLCQFTGTPKEHTIKVYIKEPALYSVGSIDKDSEGRLLLTNDGKLQLKISHSRHNLPYTSKGQVECIP